MIGECNWEGFIHLSATDFDASISQLNDFAKNPRRQVPNPKEIPSFQYPNWKHLEHMPSAHRDFERAV
jgi:hypothetical protein